MTMAMPYFMTNPKWYTEEYNEEEGYSIYKPTKETSQKAIESMEEYNRQAENGGEKIYPNDKDFYFKKNPAWYTFDKKEKMYVLTKEAFSSYLDYLGQAQTLTY